MKKLMAAVAVSTLLAACVFATYQPPEGKGPPGGGGGGKGKGPGAGQKEKGGFGRFELGRILPPFMRDELGLSEEQSNMIDALEKDVKDRLNKILTEDQKQKLNDMGRRGPGGPRGGPDDKGKGPPPGDDNRPRGKGEGGQRKGPPPGDDDRPRGKGERGEKKGPPPPPPPLGPGPGPDDNADRDNDGGIQWFGTLDRGLAEALRTGKPILFLAAAPHCGGIPGIW